MPLLPGVDCAGHMGEGRDLAGTNVWWVGRWVKVSGGVTVSRPRMMVVAGVAVMPARRLVSGGSARVWPSGVRRSS